MGEDHTHGVCEKHGPWTKNGRCFECMMDAMGAKPPYDEATVRIRDLESALTAANARVANVEGERDEARADAAALRNVLEDCHAHDMFVREGAAATDAYRKHHGSNFGRCMDKSAADHERSVRAAVDGKLGGELLTEMRGLRARAEAAEKNYDIQLQISRSLAATASKLGEVTQERDAAERVAEERRERAKAVEAERDALKAKVEHHEHYVVDAIGIVAEAEKERDALRARAEAAEAKVEELADDRLRALRHANEMTLETQTCEEAVVDLLRIVRTHRDRAEAAEKALDIQLQITRSLAETSSKLEAERDEAQRQLVDDENEAARWQDRIAETIRKHGLEPIDASGNESGDPLDWSDYQINAALNQLVEQRDEAHEKLATLTRLSRAAMTAVEGAIDVAIDDPVWIPIDDLCAFLAAQPPATAGGDARKRAQQLLNSCFNAYIENDPEGDAHTFADWAREEALEYPTWFDRKKRVPVCSLGENCPETEGRPFLDAFANGMQCMCGAECVWRDAEKGAKGDG